MSSMDDWRGARADSRSTVDEQRAAAADGDEDRAIRRFLAATEPLSVPRPPQVRPIWLLATAAVGFAGSMVWLQLAMLGTRLPLF